MIFTYLNVNKILDYFNVTLLLLLIFFNFLIYFILDTKSYFIFFSILILSTFLIILFKNLKSNFYIVLILLLMLLISLGSPVADWDARSIWLFNAKRIFYNQNLASYTNYLGSEFSHLDYPILIQTLSASLATLIGKWNEVFPKISSIIFALPAMLVISKIIKNNLDKLILMILIFFIYEKKLINGEMDALLGLYAISSVILILNFLKLKKIFFKDYLKIFLFISSLTMIKIEGLGIFLCLFITYLIVYYNYKNKTHNHLIIVFFISLLPIVTWKTFIYDQNIVASSQLMLSGGDRLFKNLLDFKFLLILIKHIILNKPMFISLLLFLIFLSKYISFNKNETDIELDKYIFSKEIIFIIITFTLYGTLLVLIFIMSEGSPNNFFEIKYFMTTSSADRLFIPVHSLIITCSIYLNKKTKKQ